MKYKDWLEEWLKNYIEPTVQARTFIRYSDIAKYHLIPKLGESEMDEITPIVLQHFVTELLQTGNLRTGKGLSANSVGSIINVMQSSLRTAYQLGYTKEYSADKIRRPKIQEKAVSCFSMQEQKKIEQAVLTSKKEKMFGILLCLYTGLWIGELLVYLLPKVLFLGVCNTKSAPNRADFTPAAKVAKTFFNNQAE